MGDDTWIKLFPYQFTRFYSYDSFNVGDLDTVDDGVIKHLFPSMNETNWNLIIGIYMILISYDHIYFS